MNIHGVKYYLNVLVSSGIVVHFIACESGSLNVISNRDMKIGDGGIGHLLATLVIRMYFGLSWIMRKLILSLVIIDAW